MSTLKIMFSQQREDEHVEDLLLKRASNKSNILTVASAGCTCFNLAQKQTVGTIDAVDLNPAQIHLCQLKKALLKHVTNAEDKIRFLEGSIHKQQQNNCSEIYQSLLRPQLSEESQNFWDNHLDLIEFGIARCGSYEDLFRELSREMHSSDESVDPFDIQSIHAHSDLWNRAFAKSFSTDNLIRLFGENAVKFSTTCTFADHFSKVFEHAASKWGKSKNPSNYFLDTIWNDQYRDHTISIPDYLKSDYVFSEEMDSKLKFHHSDFRTFLKNAKSDHYHMINTSNLTDWMPVQDVEELIQNAAEKLVHGGILLCRRLNGDYGLESLIGKYLSTDPALNKQLHDMDSSFFYSEVVAGVKL